MKGTNWLANIFSWIHLVVEEADKPISLLVQVFLPFIAPLLPALITANSLGVFMQLTETQIWIAVISFEFIGYLGMIAVVGALMRLINSDKKERLLRLNFSFYLFAYFIYLFTLIVSNAILEYKNGASWERIAVILCLTVGLSVSAGILNASRLYTRDEQEDNFVIRQEKRVDGLKRLALRKGFNVFAQDAEVAQLAQKDAQVAQAPKRNFVSSGNWRVDEGKFSKKDLEWLQDAPKDAICKEYNLKPRTAYNWKKSATKKLGK